MATQNRVRGSIHLDPVWYDSAIPEVKIKLNQDLLFHDLVKVPLTVDFDRFYQNDKHRLSVEFLNKSDSDTNSEAGLDKAIVIKQIDFFGISSQKFVWAGNYRPAYPLHLKNQPEIIESQSYLGWNGIWYLDFESPLFTWIHQIENLGWIYD